MADKQRVIALGFFDGLHIGHSALMKKVLEIGRDKTLVPSVITFDMHPQNLVSGEAVQLINSPEDRAELIHRVFGIEDIIFLHFDKHTAQMRWDDFIAHLCREFGSRHLVAGYDFKFGIGGAGNSALLALKCAELGIGCDIIPQVGYDGIPVSSTYIRELICCGDIERANAFLGHPHVLSDVVRYGFRLGRSLGTPTINMRFGEGVLVPAYGVYATKAYPDGGGEYIGVTNVGVRPTIGDDAGHITAETHILSFRDNLYGHRVRIEFYKRLRPERKFDSVDALKAQIQRDCGESSRYFSSI